MGLAASKLPINSGPPDLFLAARQDDVNALRAALAAGESLSQRQSLTGRNPIHVAVLHSSRAFLREAAMHPTAGIWLLDSAGMRPIDLCWVKNDFETHDILQNAMYSPGWFLELADGWEL